MPTPDFILTLREKVGDHQLWLSGCKAVVFRPAAASGDPSELFSDAPGSWAPDAGREVLLVRRRDSGAWTMPAGIIEPGEQPAETAVREVLEECGVVCSPGRLAGIGTTHPVTYPNGDRAQYLDVVMVLDYVSGEAQVNDDENLEVGWYSVEAIPQMPPGHRRALRWALETETDPAARFVTPDRPSEVETG